MKIQLQEHAYFTYIRDFEYIAAAAGMMSDRLDGHLCREIYGEQFITDTKQRHRELTELLNSLWLGGLELLEFIMSYPAEKFNLKEYKSFILGLPTDQYVYQFFGYRAGLQEIDESLKDEAKLGRFIDDGKFRITSFVNLKMIISDRKRFLDMYFSFLEELKTPEMEAYLDRYKTILPQLRSDMEHLLTAKKPYEAAQELRNNCFPEEDSYQDYTFIPVCMLPRDAVLYYEKNLFILYSRSRIISRQKALTILKAVSDETRLRIIDLLSERGKENGRMIASWMNLSPPTVSHHMDQLISCGIVKEEKSGNAKFYAVNREAGEQFIQELEGILLKNLDHS
jgi:DNA-binding transcriptional ArsR family regulator